MTNKRIRKKWRKKAERDNQFVRVSNDFEEEEWVPLPERLLRLFTSEYEHPRAKKEKT